MRAIDCAAAYEKLLTSEVVAYVGQIRELAVAHAVVANSQSVDLEQLRDAARIESAEASNRIEGIVVEDARLRLLMGEKTMPKNREERKIAGYREALATVSESSQYIPLTSSMVLELHAALCTFSAAPVGGRYRASDVAVVEKLPDSALRMCCELLPAAQATSAVEELCRAYREELEVARLDPLVLIPMFVLDFLCVRPFEAGNGRMSRLLTLLLLHRAGFDVGKYVSIERLIAGTQEAYYAALEASSQGWHEGENDYAPFVQYMLSVFLAAYRELNERRSVVERHSQLAKLDMVKEVARGYRGEFTKGHLMEDCRGVSQKTVERALAQMCKRGVIVKVKSGRYAAYVGNNNE